MKKQLTVNKVSIENLISFLDNARKSLAQRSLVSEQEMVTCLQKHLIYIILNYVQISLQNCDLSFWLQLVLMPFKSYKLLLLIFSWHRINTSLIYCTNCTLSNKSDFNSMKK